MRLDTGRHSVFDTSADKVPIGFSRSTTGCCRPVNLLACLRAGSNRGPALVLSDGGWRFRRPCASSIVPGSPSNSSASRRRVAAASSIPFSATSRSRNVLAARWSFGEAFVRTGCRASWRQFAGLALKARSPALGRAPCGAERVDYAAFRLRLRPRPARPRPSRSNPVGSGTGAAAPSNLTCGITVLPYPATCCP